MAISREQVVQTAEKYVSRGKIEAAIREYKKVLAENPNDANTLNRVGDLYARIQRFDDAVDFFDQIAAQYTAEGFFVKAIAIYKKIIKLNPTHLEVYERLAELYHRQGLVNEARTQYQVLADYYIKHENSTSAIAMYQKMVEVEPDNPTYHVKLAELYHQQQLTEKAMGEYRIIAELMLTHGHPQEAAQVYERALDVDATNIPFITDAVLKLREAGNGAAAARFLAIAIERNPQAERVARLIGTEEAPTPAAAGIAYIAETAETAETAGIAGFVDTSDLGDAGDATVPQAYSPFAEPEPEPDEIPSWTPEGLGVPRELFDSQPIALPQGLGEAPAAAPPAAAAPAAAKAAEPEEFDLDLDEVFVLDMESEEEPASLVKPPPDMVGEAPRRPAWAQTAEESPAAAAEPAGYTGSAADFELPGVEVAPEVPDWGSPASSLESAADEPAYEIESDLDLAGLGSGLSWEPEEAAEPGPATVGGFALGADLDLEPLPDFDALGPLPMSPVSPISPISPISPAAGPIHIDSDFLEQTAASLHPQTHQREEDLVTEAEVLAKYGLEDKALDRLTEAVRVNPGHLPAHALMIQLHLEKGRHAKVVELASQMAQAAAHATERDPWMKIRRRLLSAGYRLDGDQVLAGPGSSPIPPIAAAPAATAAPLAASAVPEADLLLPEAPSLPDLPEMPDMSEMREMEAMELPPALPELPALPTLPEPPEVPAAPTPPVAAAPAPAAPAPQAPRPPKPAAKSKAIDDLLRGLLQEPAKKPAAKRPASPAPAAPLAAAAPPPPAPPTPAAAAAPPAPPAPPP
ncbi:MAG TPA: tetratricopeptide repeat protein, partial [Thermoanaerobaculia bacterium]|nr:tetratricopeptide repeat protein [Thermoanaerobaculia bacterium]